MTREAFADTGCRGGVARRRSIQAALPPDHHDEQEGFRALMRPGAKDQEGQAMVAEELAADVTAAVAQEWAPRESPDRRLATVAELVAFEAAAWPAEAARRALWRRVIRP